MRPLKLDLRKTFRALGKEYQAAFSRAIASVGGPSTKGGGTKGGSLAREIMRPTYLRVKRWGYVLKVHALGQKLTWLVRGTKTQPARPLEEPAVDDQRAASVVADVIATSFEAWDASESRRSRA